MKVGIILTQNFRSNAYLQKLKNHGYELDEIIFMNAKRPNTEVEEEAVLISRKYGFDISRSVKSLLEESGYEFKEFNFVDINHPILIDYLKQIKLDFIIFTGGGILKKEILNVGSKFIHLHPGIVPHYRGSTCFYYSIINDNNCGVTAYIMDEKLDAGPIILQKIFEKPNHIYLDDVYDPHIRSETLVNIFQQKLLSDSKFSEQNSSESESYYIIHPVLKHIAILMCKKTK